MSVTFPRRKKSCFYNHGLVRWSLVKDTHTYIRKSTCSRPSSEPSSMDSSGSAQCYLPKDQGENRTLPRATNIMCQHLTAVTICGCYGTRAVHHRLITITTGKSTVNPFFYTFNIPLCGNTAADSMD